MFIIKSFHLINVQNCTYLICTVASVAIENFFGFGDLIFVLRFKNREFFLLMSQYVTEGQIRYQPIKGLPYTTRKKRFTEN